MKGSTFKRCTCPVEYDAKGRRKNCGKRHGSWSYVIDIGRHPETGQRRQLKKGGFPTQTAAAEEMAQKIAELGRGTLTHDEGMSVRDYLEKYLQQRATHYRPTTLSNTRRWLRSTYVYIGHLRLRDLRTHHISEMNRQLLAAATAKGQRPTTTCRVHGALSAALGAAVKEELIHRNPARDAWRPDDTPAKVRPWSPEDLGKFLDAAATSPLGSLFEVMALTGLRRGEALGLRWSDVNLVAGHLVVRQQITSTEVDEDTQQVCPSCGAEHRGLVFGPPKTRTGEEAMVDLGQAAVGALMAHKLRQDQERAEWGELYVDHDLVFADVDGNPRRPDYATKVFVRLVKETGLRPIRLHDLRHGRASMLLAGGADIAIVSKMLRHSSVRLTSDTYAHLLEGVGRSAAEAADALVVRRQVVDEAGLIEAELEALGREITAPGADVAAIAARIAELQAQRASVTDARGRDQSVTNRPQNGIEALP